MDRVRSVADQCGKVVDFPGFTRLGNDAHLRAFPGANQILMFAALIGYGADAIHPYLTYATYKQVIEDGALSISYEEAVTKYSKSVTEGVVKVMSKMGISTVQSYRGAQIFEAVGISRLMPTASKICAPR